MIKKTSKITKREIPTVGKVEKRQPSFTDEDVIAFGKYIGKKLKDVPAQYLVWLHNQGNTFDERLNNYIYNNWEALQQELPEDKRCIY